MSVMIVRFIGLFTLPFNELEKGVGTRQGIAEAIALVFNNVGTENFAAGSAGDYIGLEHVYTQLQDLSFHPGFKLSRNWCSHLR